MASSRTQPNIIITGTPGVGKTTHCEVLAQNTGLRHLSINDIVKERACHEGWDEERSCWIVDEDKVSILISDVGLGISWGCVERGKGKGYLVIQERFCQM